MDDDRKFARAHVYEHVFACIQCGRMRHASTEGCRMLVTTVIAKCHHLFPVLEGGVLSNLLSLTSSWKIIKLQLNRISAIILNFLTILFYTHTKARARVWNCNTIGKIILRKKINEKCRITLFLKEIILRIKNLITYLRCFKLKWLLTIFRLWIPQLSHMYEKTDHWTN